MTIKSLAIVAAVFVLPVGASTALGQSQTLVEPVSGEATAPSAKGDVELFNLNKALKCKPNDTACTAQLNGKKGKQTLITNVSCLVVVTDGIATFGAITTSKMSSVTRAIFPVASRAVSGTTEVSVIAGPTSVVLAPDDRFTIGVAATSETIDLAVCNVTGTITKL